MKKLLATLFLLITSMCYIFAQDDMQTGIIYGPTHAFSLTAPQGWVLDNKAGVNQGIYAVFYKEGESWNKAETVMYANTTSLEKKAHSSLDELINYDLDRFKRNYLDIEIRDGADIEINEQTIAKVKYLSGESYGNFEAIAYIDAGKTGVMIVLSSRSQEGFDNNLDNFRQLVKSYVFISDNVKDMKRK